MKKFWTTIALLLITATAYAYTCQYDDLQLFWTGEIKIEYGKLAKLYECAAGHQYWIAD